MILICYINIFGTSSSSLMVISFSFLSSSSLSLTLLFSSLLSLSKSSSMIPCLPPKLGKYIILIYIFLNFSDFSNKGTNNDVKMMVKNMTEKTILLTLSEPVSCDCEIIVARTAAARPLGIIIDKKALSLLLMPLMPDGNEILTTYILRIIIKNEMPSPINNDIKLSNFIEIPT